MPRKRLAQELIVRDKGGHSRGIRADAQCARAGDVSNEAKEIHGRE